MKLKFGCIVADGRGSLGGSVIAKCRSGHYMRTKVTPINTRSVYNFNIRSQIARFASQWRTLSQVQRNAWSSAVSNFMKTDVFGDKRKQSGFHLFCGLNSNLSLIGSSPILVPPLNSQVRITRPQSLTARVSTQILSLVMSGSVPSGSELVIMATPPVSRGRKYFSSEYRIIYIANQTSPMVMALGSYYIAKFGAIGVIGQVIMVKGYFVNAVTGVKSGLFIFKTTIIN